MSEYGEVKFQGKEYTLKEQAFADGKSPDDHGVWACTAEDAVGNEYKVTWDFGEEVYAHDGECRIVVVDDDRYLDSDGNTTDDLDAPTGNMGEHERGQFLSRHHVGYEFVEPDQLPWDDDSYIVDVRPC